jgi:hypothetical protein
MNPTWFMRPDWPMDWEIERRSALMLAVQNLPNGDVLGDDDVEGNALLLFSTSEWGRNEEMPQNRPSTGQKSEKDLRKLMDLCAKTVAHIEQMNRPAVGAFFAEGGDLWTLKDALAQASEIAGHSLGHEVEDSPRGPRKIEAAQVTETAAMIFEHVSGQGPTFTTDPISNEIRGPWPKFLSSIFDALRINASVEAQAKALREKHPAN